MLSLSWIILCVRCVTLSFFLFNIYDKIICKTVLAIDLLHMASQLACLVIRCMSFMIKKNSSNTIISSLSKYVHPQINVIPWFMAKEVATFWIKNILLHHVLIFTKIHN